MTTKPNKKNALTLKSVNERIDFLVKQIDGIRIENRRLKELIEPIEEKDQRVRPRIGELIYLERHKLLPGDIIVQNTMPEIKYRITAELGKSKLCYTVECLQDIQGSVQQICLNGFWQLIHAAGTPDRVRPKVGEFVDCEKHEIRPGDIISGPLSENAEVTNFFFDTVYGATIHIKYVSKVTQLTTTAAIRSNYSYTVVSLVEQKPPDIHPSKKWIKKGEFAKIDPKASHYYTFLSDPVYDYEIKDWTVSAECTYSDGGKRIEPQARISYDWIPFNKKFWDELKIGNKVKLTYHAGSKLERSYIGRVFEITSMHSARFIVDIVENPENANISPGSIWSILAIEDITTYKIIKD